MILRAADADRGSRLDSFVNRQLPSASRSRIQAWIRDGRVLVDGIARKPSYELRGTETIHVEPAAPPPLQAAPEDLPITILYEDAAVIAVDKPAGLVVHAGAGVESGTLVNRLVHHFGALSSVGGDLRPGIVHRLDRFTSGVLLVARNDAAHQALAAQFSGRTVEKIYLAVVHGEVESDAGRITAPIARDPVRRTRMTARAPHGRTALTEYRVVKRWPGFTCLEVRIGTGRTHQIRVHLSSVGHPVVGDSLYGAPKGRAGRYLLHAWRISFDSPAAGARVRVEAPVPEDLASFVADLDRA